MGSWKGRGNQYIHLVKVLHCKLTTNGKRIQDNMPVDKTMVKIAQADKMPASLGQGEQNAGL